MANCCDSMLKYIVFLFNFAFFATGCILIGIGAYVQIQMKNYFDFLGNPFLNSSVIFIIIGCIILVVAFFGCCGACTENACMLYTYSTLMALILCVEIGLAVTIYIFKGDARDFVSNAMQKGMQNYDTAAQSEHAGVTETWNIVQADFHCCGVESYKDWGNVTFGQSSRNVPQSCCITSVAGCGDKILTQDETTAAKTIYTNGCFKKLEGVIMDNVAAVAGVGVGIAVFQVLAVIVSCFLAANMRRKDNYV